MKLVAIFLFALIVAGCSTVAGAGKDITHGSDWVKSKMSGGNSTQKTTPVAPKPEPIAPAEPASPTSI